YQGYAVDSEITKRLNKIINRLAMSGDDSYRIAAFNNFQSELAQSVELQKNKDLLSSEDKLAKEIERYQLDKDQAQSYKNKLQEQIEVLQKNIADAASGSVTDEQKLDWLIRTSEKMLEANDYQFVVVTYPTFSIVLKHYGKENELAKIDELIEKKGKEKPEIYVAMASTTKNFQNVGYFALNMIFPVNTAHVPSIDNEETLTLQEEHKKVTAWLDKAIAAYKQSPSRTPIQVAEFESQLNLCFMQLIQTFTTKITQPLGVSGNEMQMVYSGRGFYMPYINENETRESKPLTKENLDKIQTNIEAGYILLDYMLNVQKDLSAFNIKFKVNTAKRQQAALTLSQYRYYFQGRQNLDSYMLSNFFMPDSSTTAQFLNFFGKSLKRVDTLLKESQLAEGVSKDELRTDYFAQFETYMEKLKTSENSDDRKIFEAYSDLAIIPMQNQNQQEFDVEQLKDIFELQYKEAVEKGEAFDSQKLLLLALLYNNLSNKEKAIECLDAIPFTAAQDVKMRETIVMSMFAQEPELKERVNTAIERLKGYQLTDEELRILRNTYVMLDRKDEADALFDRLLTIANNQSTQYELLNELSRYGDEKKEQAITFALKVYRASNTNTSQRGNMNEHLRNSAIQVLQRYDKLGEIIEQLESQKQSLANSTDFMTNLADTYQRAGRTDDAKKIALEIGEKIPDDPQKMLSYSNLLSSLGMSEESLTWKKKAFKKNPALILNKYW
ncbi:MAG: hypothetical protein ACRC2T_18325, partial [Thermoguttaceae bacterium]